MQLCWKRDSVPSLEKTLNDTHIDRDTWEKHIK